MKQVQSYSYLDLSVHTELAPHVLAADATVLFNNKLDSILWTNHAGAKLFGGDGIVELLNAKLSNNQTFVRQLRDAVSQIEDGRPLIRGFRVSIGDRSALMQFEISPINFSDGNVCFKVCQKSQAQSHAAIDEHHCATSAVESLNGFADAAAIVDDFGLPLAMTSGFADLGPDETNLRDLILELKQEDDRLIKRQIESAKGKQVAAGLGRVSDEPPRNLVVLAVASEEDAPQDVQAKGDTNLAEETKNTVWQQSTSIDTADAEVELPNESDTPELPSSQPHAVEELPLEKASIEKGSAPKVQAIPEKTDQDSDYELNGIAQTASKTEPQEDGQVRFSWTTDEDSKFTQVSPELAEAVGKPAADVLGRQWSEVATVFGFDTDREIGSLLGNRDTWSGKTVLWPIAGTDMVVPIDLAALPIFDSDRDFSGFRGFGIIRTLDTIVDPEETGLALVEQAGESEVVKPTLLEEESIEASNIIPMRPQFGKPEDSEDQLTSTESDAFEKIGARLKSEFGESTDTGETKPTGSYRKPNTSLIENLPVAILVYRNDEILFGNQRFFETTGYQNAEELVASGGIECLFDPNLSQDDENRSYRLVRKDGESFPVNPVLHLVPWDGEKAMQLSFGSSAASANPSPPALDITHASEMQSILDITSDGIILLKDDGEVISVNSSAEALFNCSFDDAVGKHLTTLFADDSHPDINQYINGLSTPGIEGLLQEGREVIALESSGGLMPVLLTIAPLKSSGKLCAVIRDLTTWKQTELELIKSRRDAERSSEQKTDFLAQVSHEVRIPLTAIIGFSDIMIGERFGPINNERYREYLRDIKRSGQHVLDLVNDLLDLSKIEAGKLELNFEGINLNDIVTEAVAMLQPHANSNRIIIRTSLSRSVPKVVADLRSIRQVVLNLVTNAIKFSPSNSQVIVSTVYESSGEVALRIRDTGTGMSENEIEEAMKPYNQLNNVAEKSNEGTGLGLPLTKALIEANRAYFDLESEPGKGTIAHVQFPIQRVLAD